MIAEATWKRVVRIHVSGDFDQADYVRKWIQIVRACPHTAFYAYTRSWRAHDVRILEALVELAALPNMALNLSVDRETGIPGWLEGAFSAGRGKICWLALDDQDLPMGPGALVHKVGIVFRHKRQTVMAIMGGSVVCPVEMGISNQVTCQSCRLCFGR